MSKKKFKWTVCIERIKGYSGVYPVSRFDRIPFVSEETARNVFNTLVDSAIEENYWEIYLEQSGGIEDHYSNPYWKREDE